jgi:hypothetical protein
VLALQKVLGPGQALDQFPPGAHPRFVRKGINNRRTEVIRFDSNSSDSVGEKILRSGKRGETNDHVNKNKIDYLFGIIKLSRKISESSNTAKAKAWSIVNGRSTSRRLTRKESRKKALMFIFGHSSTNHGQFA